MATITATRVSKYGQTHQTTWAAVGQGDDGSAEIIPGAADRSVHVFGTYGAGGSVILQGSNEDTPSNWETLHDSQGNDLDISADGIYPVAENPLWIRPLFNSGDGTSNVTVIVLSRRTG